MQQMTVLRALQHAQVKLAASDCTESIAARRRAGAGGPAPSHEVVEGGQHDVVGLVHVGQDRAPDLIKLG